MEILFGWMFLMSEISLYPSSDQGVLFNPAQVLGSYACPTVGANWLLATQGEAPPPLTYAYMYRGDSLIRNRHPVRPYSRTIPRVLGGVAVPYERGTSVAASLFPGTSKMSCKAGSCNPSVHRDTSLIRKRNPLGAYRRPMPRVLGWSWGGTLFFISETPPVASSRNLSACSGSAGPAPHPGQCSGKRLPNTTAGPSYRGTSLVRKTPLLGLYSRTNIGSYGGPRGMGCFL